jgi:hypothetical protein
MVKAFFEVNFPDPRKIEESAQVVVGIDTIEKMALVVSSSEEAIKNRANMFNWALPTLCS